jgi:hypothetical protein
MPGRSLKPVLPLPKQWGKCVHCDQDVVVPLAP